MRGAMIDRYIQTPLEIERKLGLLRANVMHLEMSLDQMFFFRPLPELSTYRTHLPGLYLTGASTHPGRRRVRRERTEHRAGRPRRFALAQGVRGVVVNAVFRSGRRRARRCRAIR